MRRVVLFGMLFQYGPGRGHAATHVNDLFVRLDVCGCTHKHPIVYRGTHPCRITQSKWRRTIYTHP